MTKEETMGRCGTKKDAGKSAPAKQAPKKEKAADKAKKPAKKK